MKKKVFVALAVAMAVLPCFAEIRVKRDGARDGGITVNLADYWNDKYFNDFSPTSAKELLKDCKKAWQKKGLDNFNCTVHYYFGYDGFYYISLFHDVSGVSRIDASHVSPDGYKEILFSEEYVFYNSAKAEFDSLCEQYYNEIK